MHVQSKSQEPNNVIFQLYCEDIMKTPHVHQKRKIKKKIINPEGKTEKNKRNKNCNKNCNKNYEDERE